MEPIRELLKENNYQEENFKYVECDNSGITNSKQFLIGTDDTYSCTNLLVYSDMFAYLVHMLPSEAIGSNSKLDDHLDHLKSYLEVFKGVLDNLKVRVICGEIENKDNDYKVHNLEYLNKKLEEIELYCNKNNIIYTRLEDLNSKYVLFDYKNENLIVDNAIKKPRI